MTLSRCWLDEQNTKVESEQVKRQRVLPKMGSSQIKSNEKDQIYEERFCIEQRAL